MKKLFIILLSALSLTAVAQQKKVAILETVDKEGNVPYGIKFQVRSSLTFAINHTTGYEGLDRVDMSSIAGEQNFQRTGLVSDEQIKRLGIMTGAQYVLIAEAALYDNQNIIIAAKMLDVETGGVTNSAPPSIANKDPEKMQAACINVAKILLGIKDISNNSNNGFQTNSSKLNHQDYIENAWNINMKMIWVEGGDFYMGCTSEQGNDCREDEKTIRRITIDGFYIGMLEVTQLQWEKVMGRVDYNALQEAAGNIKGLQSAGPDYPIFQISWDYAIKFCRKLSDQTGKTYTLPTEAQWEYAARGGKKSEGTKYAGGNNINDIAWYFDGSGYHAVHPCGTKRPNELGIYDMSGNVWEWCKDWYRENYIGYDTDNPEGPISPSNGKGYVIRGGSWTSRPEDCRVTARSEYHYISMGNLGFRVVCIP